MTRLRSVIHGRMNASQSWSIGLNHTTSFSSADQTDVAALAESIYQAFLTNVWNESASFQQKSFISTTGSVDGCSVYYYGAGGNQATVVGESSGASSAGTRATAYWPGQCALVCSLLSGLSGRSNRGRLYMPRSGGVMDNTLRDGASDVDNLARQVALWISAVDALSFGTGLAAVITSPRDNAPTVTQVVVDNVVDTQRRRRDKTLSTHQGVGTVT